MTSAAATRREHRMPDGEFADDEEREICAFLKDPATHGAGPVDVLGIGTRR